MSDPTEIEPESDTRITVRLLDPTLESALTRYCANKRRKKTDVVRSALVEMLEAEGYLTAPDALVAPEAV
jgi:hypothetical protein